LLYNDAARVQLNDTSTTNITFYYEPASVTRDTVYIQVNTIGGFTDYNRDVKLIQVPEYNYSYTRDPVTNQVIDTIATEKPYKAVAGVHYVAMDDPSLKDMVVVKAHQVTAQIPVILLRDTSLKTNSYRLRLQLVGNSEFGLGELKSAAVTIVFSDHLERFYSWRVDGYTASAYSSFGKYSIAKHQFMVDVLKVKIDEAWYQAILAMQAQSHYKNLLKEALSVFNNDPANIASGKAPLRETSSPNSPIVTFP
ncbi:MAG TPA: DUF4843 domain-containing protein, partial [Pedobacter sp.]